VTFVTEGELSPTTYTADIEAARDRLDNHRIDVETCRAGIRPADPASDFRLAAGMTVVVQPDVVTGDGRAGVQTGELLLVTDHGPQRMHAYPPGLQQAG
jgi:Xaa-Pro aminopeptidase